MQKSLVIVESPTKAKTINKYLGKKYIVKSSIGHVRDLVTKKSKKNTKNSTNNRVESSVLKNTKKDIFIRNIGINPYQNWKSEYQILPGKEEIVSELKNIANQVNFIYLATDLDREGEAIAWHLREVIGGDSSKFKRVVFNEITERSIKKAFEKIVNINMHKVYAQQARRFMDRIVGYMISPLLWKKISRGLSAGRVQSVAVRIISEREYSIKNFIPKEYWKLNVSFSFQKIKNIIFNVTHFNKRKFNPIDEKNLNISIKKIKKSCFFVKSKTDKTLYKKPPVPFTTSTLQQSSNLVLGFSVKKTMFLSQKLYEEGYITYTRTDSTYVNKYAIKATRTYIKKNYGNNYISNKLNIRSNLKHSQEAHEAIRPCDINTKKLNSKNLNSDSQKLYTLIWNRFIASQMISAKYQSTTIVVSDNEFILQKNEKILIFEGWVKILKEEKNNASKINSLKTGNLLLVDEITSVKKFTKPLARFNEASLVKELEKKGIGRPSTYSSIISKIQERGYVKIKNNQFYAEKMGEILTIRLKKNFSDLLNYDFTANMEKKLDKIAENKLEWKQVLDSFFENFSKQLKKAQKNPEEGGMEPNNIVMTSIKCPLCCKEMGIKNAITGVFLSCSGYNSEPHKSCKHTINLISLNEIEKPEKDSINIKKTKLINKCKKCKMAMDSYFIEKKTKIHICINNPSCHGYEIEKGNFNVPIYLSKIIQCEKCLHDMILKNGKFGKFLICTKKQCKNTRKILPNGRISDPKLEPIHFPKLLCKNSNAWFVLREGVSGIFFAANTFPKSRETRSPLIEELAKFQNLLPNRIRYLASAPKIDDQGNKTIVCFDKIKKEHYVSSKKEGKFTGWSAFFIKNQWFICNKSN